MTKADILAYLSVPLGDLSMDETLFAEAVAVRNATIGDKVRLRGLIELSNRCRKNCLYCGIRCGNTAVERYELTDGEVLGAAEYAWRAGYGSVVIQAGERVDEGFIERIESLLIAIKQLSNNGLGITLSLGEQDRETYQRWFRAGAHRYLLRIESSSPELYGRIHSVDHSYARRRECLEMLREEGYQVGTGVMIGLPYQTMDHLADDLLFFRELDVDMCGMGPYIEFPGAPLVEVKAPFTRPERLQLALRMIALLRLLMPNINIASTTALHALHPQGRELGIAAGANVLMPNLTPEVVRGSYRLYDNKPLMDMDLDGFNVSLGNEWGDSHHFAERTLEDNFATSKVSEK